MFKLSILLIALTLVCSENVPESSNGIAECIDAIKVLPADVMNVIEAIKAFDIEKAITAVTDLVDDAKKAFAECTGKKDLTTNWSAFQKCISSGPICNNKRGTIENLIKKGEYGLALEEFWKNLICFKMCEKYL